MERNKMLGLIAAVIAAVLMAIAGKSCVKDAKNKNAVTQQPTIIVSPQIVDGDNGNYTPAKTSPPATSSQQTTPPEVPVQTEKTSKSKLDELWEKSNTNP